MNINQLPKLQRREFLRRSAQLGLAGIAAPWALNLASIGQAAAASVGSTGDYKALVCVFLYGGNDYGRTLLPYDLEGYNNLCQLRGGSTAQGGLVALREDLAGTVLTPKPGKPLTGSGAAGTQLAMAAELSPLKPLFDNGKLGWILNTGTLVQPTSKNEYQSKNVPLPPRLFSHNDQQSVWQSSGAEGATKGWGGAMGDLFLSDNQESTFTCMNTSGNAVFMTGRDTLQYQVSTEGAIAVNGLTDMYGSSACSQALRNLITSPRGNWFEAELNRITKRSVEAESKVSTALGNNNSLPFNTVFEDTSLGRQLKMVARLIAGRQSLGAKRQVFFVSLSGFDTHDFLVKNHPLLLQEVGASLAAFQAALTELNVANSVTTFTASDFGRTLTSNGDGSDHGWGSHHLVMGGAVQGGRFWGQMPILADDGPDDVGQGRLLPTTGVDQVASTLAKWFGVSDSAMTTVVPNINNFSQRDLGFFSA